MVENTTTKRTFVEKVRDRMESRKVEGESGSLLLDILLGMAIFALIAVIAVSAFSQYRARAYEQSAVSDANAIGVAVEAALTDGLTPTATQVAGSAVTLGEDTVTLSHDGDNVVSGFAMGSAYDFSFCVSHDGKEFAEYNSAQGGLVDRGRTGGCA